MEETALAVLVFNPQSDNPFEGLGQWDRDLQRAVGRTFRKLLVAGRCDVGGLRDQGSLDVLPAADFVDISRPVPGRAQGATSCMRP